VLKQRLLQNLGINVLTVEIWQWQLLAEDARPDFVKKLLRDL